MSTPASPLNRSLTEQSTRLRQELKEWEKTFAAANSGRKAGRDDIKKDAVIAAKYKTYNKLREQTSNGSSSSPPRPTSRHQYAEQQSPKKRKRAPLDDVQSPRSLFRPPSQTPRKGQKHHTFATPLKAHSRHHSEDSPSTLKRLFSPGEDMPVGSPYLFRTSIGPTPQRDGKILGLFDLLSQSGGSMKSTTRNRNDKGHTIDSGEEILKTPSRHKVSEDRNHSELLDAPADDEETSRTRRHSRTPASHGKRFLFSTFLKTPTAFKITPTKQRTAGLIPDIIETAPAEEVHTSDTPSFHQRFVTINAPALSFVDEMGKLSPVAVRMPPKLLGRGLSALVQGLRDMAEEENDDDLDALREMEDEEMGGPKPVNMNTVLVKDSQANPFISVTGAGVGGFGVDLEPIVEEDGDVQGAAQVQQPTKVWKKKGLKRQTRRFVMKPRAKVKSTRSDERSEDGNDDQTVAETQRGTLQGLLTGEEPQQEAQHNDDDEFHDTDGESAEEGPKSKKTASKKAKDLKSEKDKPKKPGKKQNPNAHANFRALKIKNRNSKAKGRGRFGRRR